MLANTFQTFPDIVVNPLEALTAEAGETAESISNRGFLLLDLSFCALCGLNFCL